MHKRIVMLVTSFGIIMSMGTTTVLATPLGDSQSRYNESHASVQQLEDKIQKMDNQIQNIMYDRDNTNKKIDQAQKDIDQAQKDIETSKENIKEEKDKFAERMRALYISGNNQSYVDILLKSKSFSDMLSRVEAIKQVVEYDDKLVSQLKTSENRIQTKKDTIVSQKEKLVALNKENDAKLKQINDEKAKENVIVAQAKAKENTDATALKAEKDAQKAAQSKLLAMNTASTKPISRGGSFSGSGNAFVSYAAQFFGVPYVYGGESPSGFDCSGLVQYVYGNCGVSLPRTTQEQVNSSALVTVSGAPQPGDLLYFGSPSAPHHVAIYAGNGQMIEAPQTGDVVKITGVRGYSVVKRVR